jgi:glycosyltransferase involved in cell wall biosynthesis
MSEGPTRVLHVVPSLEHVGALRRIALLASGLEPERFEFRVAALSEHGPDPRDLDARNLPVTALAAGRRFRLALAWQLRRLLGKWRPDFVHAWDSSALSVARLATLGLKHVRLVDNAVCEDLLGVDATKLRDQSAAGESRAAFLASFALPANARLLGTAEQLTPAKRTAELLWALDQIHCVRDDVYLLIMGDGEARPFYERYARLYEIEEHVRFLGWRSDVPALLAHLDVYCSASNERQSSLALLEAMALGVPVVASDTAAHRHLVISGETGFLAPVEQRSEIARWCLRVLEDTELAKRMSEASVQRAMEHFPVEVFVAGYRELYYKAAGWHGRRGDKGRG